MVADKDIDTLGRSIASLINLVDMDIDRVVLIGPSASRLSKFAEARGHHFVDELELIGFGPERYKYPEPSMERSGWLYQQMLKLAWAAQSPSNAYVVVDADTIFVGPVQFAVDGRYQLYLSEEWHEPYSQAVKQLLGHSNPSWLSFVAHMMVFDTAMVVEMLDELELRHGVVWHEAIAATRRLDEWSCFSEYQLYAVWAQDRHPDRCATRPLYNRSAARLHSYLPDPNG